jgi:hypothetical protein
MAREICNSLTKAEWQPCAYSNYRWTMEQEIRHLYTCFGGLGEEGAVVRAQRRAKVLLAKAHEDVERARDRIGLHLQEATGGGGSGSQPRIPTRLPERRSSRGEPTLHSAS